MSETPTLKSWLRDGATLAGLDAQAREKLKTQGQSLLKGAAKDLETIEGGVRTLEQKMVAGLRNLRNPKKA